MDKHLHIVSFDIPYPANYGGVIDVFYKIKALHELGVKVHLHCFEYGREHADELNRYCSSVHYYKRHTTKGFLFRRKPYIVATRFSEKLMDRLQKDKHPILFEGLHSCMYLDDERIMKRFKVVRAHNIEHEYYHNLAMAEHDFFKKYFFLNEVGKLQRFERGFCNAQMVAAISKADARYFNGKYPNVQHISAFHPNSKVDIEAGKGKYCLYHGSLEVSENNQAALYLVKKIFNRTDIPLIIAGNRPSKELMLAAEKQTNITFRTNVDTETIYKLISEAQINVLPTFQSTGIKLKLLAALYRGRHCLVNSPMVIGTGLEPLCRVEDDDDRFLEAIESLFTSEFERVEVRKREAILYSQFCNRVMARKLYQGIFGCPAPDMTEQLHSESLK